MWIQNMLPFYKAYIKRKKDLNQTTQLYASGTRKVNRKKEIINIRAQINQIENRKKNRKNQ